MGKLNDSDTQGKIVWAECQQCESITKHTVERACEWSDHNKGADISAWIVYQIVRCNGCDSLSYRTTRANSEEMWINEDGRQELVETVNLYPERKKHSIVDGLYLRSDHYHIPEVVREIYRETLKSVDYNLPTLAGIGVRAVIEAICRDRKTKKNSLFDKIEELLEMSLLTPSGAKILHSIRLMGNSAAHDMKAPATNQISAALKVIDHLLLGVYVLPQEVLVLPRATRKKKQTATAKYAKNVKKNNKANDGRENKKISGCDLAHERWTPRVYQFMSASNRSGLT